MWYTYKAVDERATEKICTLKNEQCEFLKVQICTKSITNEFFTNKKFGNSSKTKEKSARMSKVYKNPMGFNITSEREFDPGSGRTLAACLTHASRTRNSNLISSERRLGWTVADGRVTRE